jgi:hypothetical protein
LSKLRAKDFITNKKKPNVEIAAIFKRVWPLCYCQQHENLILHIKDFKIPKEMLVRTIVTVGKMTPFRKHFAQHAAWKTREG